jgi:hypothetical protein
MAVDKEQRNALCKMILVGLGLVLSFFCFAVVWYEVEEKGPNYKVKGVCDGKLVLFPFLLEATHVYTPHSYHPLHDGGVQLRTNCQRCVYIVGRVYK